uniref:Uncharacterized protein n=1 Tax=Anguilla anguilla TaxID=7936 RepID=A0A0E9QQW6_ANGAN
MVLPSHVSVTSKHASHRPLPHCFRCLF